MSIIIDGSQAYKVFNPERGVVNVALRWIALDSKREERPAMFIYPKPHVRKAGAGAFVIPLDLAFQYQALDMGDKRELQIAIQAASEAAQAMKLTPDKYTITNICDVIFNYLPDLLTMPPKRMVISKADEAAEAGNPIGEMILKLDGKAIHEQEVTHP